MTSDEDKNVLAAEYVLGTLDADDRANVQMLLAIDPAFAASVAGWERRFGELHALVSPIDPPQETWEWIKARIASVPQNGQVWLPSAEEAAARAPIETAPSDAAANPPPAQSVAQEVAALASEQTTGEVVALAPMARKVRRWRNAAVGVTALAATLAAVVVTRELRPDALPPALRPRPYVVEKPVEVVREVPSARMAEFVAVFQKDDASPQFLLTVDVEKRTLSVRKVGAEQQANRSYELWILPVGATAPRSLGVLAEQDFTVRRALADYDAPTINNATFGISLEPAGGSPTGAPTGPVLHGKLLQATPPAFPGGAP